MSCHPSQQAVPAGKGWGAGALLMRSPPSPLRSTLLAVTSHHSVSQPTAAPRRCGFTNWTTTALGCDDFYTDPNAIQLYKNYVTTCCSASTPSPALRLRQRPHHHGCAAGPVTFRGFPSTMFQGCL